MPWKWPRWMASRRPDVTPRKRIGLALSGGAVRGAAHIGVLEVLKEARIRPDIVAGVSAGSAIGALHCAGYSPSQLRELALEMKWRRLTRFRRPHLSLFDTGPMEQYLDELLASKSFADLETPFVALAADILTSTEVALSAGPVARAVRASCAIPGLFTPIEWDEHLLVDGGIMNNLPVQVLRDLGADYVIAVDVMSSMGVNRRPRNIFEMCLLSAYAALRVAYRESQEADCIIHPAVSDLSLVDFDDVPELIARGRLAAEASLNQVQRDLGLAGAASGE